MKRLAKRLILTLTAGMALKAITPCLAAVPQTQPVPFFTELRQENIKALTDVDGALDKLMTTTLPTQSLSEVEARVKFLRARRQELLSRQDFLNRMILQADSKFRGGDVQDFLRMALKEMSVVEVKSDSQQNSMWKFLNYLALSIESLPKGQMDVLKFVEGYMKRSTFQNPIEPKEYISSLDYYNGVHSERAQGVTAEQAADMASDTVVESTN